MGEVEVKLDKLKAGVGVLENCARAIDGKRNEIESIALNLSLPRESAAQMKKQLRRLSDQAQTCKNQTNALKDALSNIKSQYEITEKEIIGKNINRATYSFSDTNAHADIKTGISGSAKTDISGSVFNISGKTTGAFGEASAGASFLTAMASASTHGEITKNKISGEAKVEGSAALFKGQASVGGKYGEASVNAEIFSAAVSASTSGAIEYKNGKLSAKAEVSAGASVSAASGKAEGRLGTEDFNAHGKASGSLLGAGAQAKAGVSVDSFGNFSAKAEAGAEAFLAKGEVSGGFTLFGIKVEVGGEAGIGVQAKAKGEVSSSGLAANLGLGPIGGKVKIDWSGFNLAFWKK